MSMHGFFSCAGATPVARLAKSGSLRRATERRMEAIEAISFRSHSKAKLYLTEGIRVYAVA
jgi:hypothetical protein